MRRWIKILIVVAVLAATALFVTRPRSVDGAALAGLTPDAVNGEWVFYASGCASCHAAPGAKDEAKRVLAGGQAFPSDFGTFYAPNISSDPEHGIGAWSAADIVSAVVKGTSPQGAHYYPAFPYASYAKMTLQDAVDLAAFLPTLPADATPSRAHDVGFPFNIRLSLGGWKLLFGDPGWIMQGELSDEVARGRYLVEALGHCGECHTARNALGGIDTGAWLAGAPNPSGKGRIPDITPAKLTWSAADIAEYLKSGFTPDYDSAGGHMVAVIDNTARLSDADRMAIAAYLKALN